MLYDSLAFNYGAEFCAFAVESYGAFIDEAQAFCKAVSDYASLSGATWPWRAIRRGMVNSIAMAVQKGNALAVLGGLQRSLGFGGSRQVAARGSRCGFRRRG